MPGPPCLAAAARRGADHGACLPQTIVVGSAFRRHQRQLDLVSRVSLLSELTRGEQETVADGLQPELFEVCECGLWEEKGAAALPLTRFLSPRAVARLQSGTVIIRQGEAGHKVYLVQEGEVAVAKRVTPSHPPRHLLSLGPGHYFGEVCVPSLVPRWERGPTPDPSSADCAAQLAAAASVSYGDSGHGVPVDGPQDLRARGGADAAGAAAGHGQVQGGGWAAGVGAERGDGG